MDLKRISKFLVIFGIVLVVIAFTMDTSVSSGYSRVYNIGLMSQQQNLLLVGGLAFIGGIILIATDRNSKSSEEVVKIHDIDESVSRNIDRLEGYSKSASDKLFGLIDRWMTTKRDNKKGRVAILFYTSIFAINSFVFFIVLTLYAMRPIPANKVITHFLYLHTVLSSGLLLLLAFTGFDAEETRGLLKLLFFTLVITLNILIIRRLKRTEVSSNT